MDYKFGPLTLEMPTSNPGLKRRSTSLQDLNSEIEKDTPSSYRRPSTDYALADFDGMRDLLMY